MKVYHGTYYSAALDILYNGIDLTKGNYYTDFGQGFYTTPNKEKARQRALQVTLKYNSKYKTNDVPCIVVCNFVIPQDKATISIKEFYFREDEWFYFVIHNRLNPHYLNMHNITNHNQDYKYDIVIGEVADGSIANIAYSINNNLLDINDVNLSDIVPYNNDNYGLQISFHTKTACSCIMPKNCDIIRL